MSSAQASLGKMITMITNLSLKAQADTLSTWFSDHLTSKNILHACHQRKLHQPVDLSIGEQDTAHELISSVMICFGPTCNVPNVRALISSVYQHASVLDSFQLTAFKLAHSAATCKHRSFLCAALVDKLTCATLHITCPTIPTMIVSETLLRSRSRSSPDIISQVHLV